MGAGVQFAEEKRENRFDSDLLDATKMIPEEFEPVTRIGKMTLNRNPDNISAETEQVVFLFCPRHLVGSNRFISDP